MSVELTGEIHSLSQLSEVIYEIERLLGRLQDSKVQQDVQGAPVGMASASARLQRLADLNSFNTIIGADLEQLLEELKMLRDKAPQVRLTLAGWPDAAVQERLVEWFRRQINPNVLVKFVVRSDICGGVIVQTDNRRHDLSYRELLINKRQRISELAYHAG